MRTRLGSLALAAQRPLQREAVLLCASVVLLLVGNGRFLALALAGREALDPSAWGLALALAAGLVAINFVLLALVAWGRLFKPAITALFVLAAATAFFADSFGTFVDPAMLRNALHTYWGEARELIGARLALSLLLGAALPAWLLWRLPLAPRTWPRALAWRAGSIALALAVLVGAVWAAFQPLASLMRSQRELRYLVTPGNVLWSAAVLARRAGQEPKAPLQAVGIDAAPGPTLLHAERPRLVVLVVGETARAANWGLNGYARQTTPELARLPLISFPDVTSCGTDTETSLPCMFAEVGRRRYDEPRIRRSENLLHVLARAGVAVHWRDNQAGCKGVCAGFANDFVAANAPPGLCHDGQCRDEGLLFGLDALLPGTAPGLPRARFVVLHQIGNHGPAYHRRVPPAFKRYQPACEHDDLRRCDAASITNAYDNAILYTDHVLARLITQLQARERRVDSAVLYVSDHGESLGEHGLFLHGMPYAIAPEVQKRVPMLLWLSSGFAEARGIDAPCLAGRAGREQVSHDHLFHTVLGLFDVQTTARDVPWDLTHGCTSRAAAELAARAP